MLSERKNELKIVCDVCLENSLEYYIFKLSKKCISNTMSKWKQVNINIFSNANILALRSGGTIANEVHPRRGYC